MSVFRPLPSAACALLVGLIVCGPRESGVFAQDDSGARMPTAALLAIRARPGDTVKMVGDNKITTHIHLEALASEFSTEATVKDDTTYSFRGRGPNGAMQFEVHETSHATTTNPVSQATQQATRHLNGLYTIKPNLSVIKISALASSRQGKTPPPPAIETFGTIRFPDKTLKPGDSWSGTTPVVGSSDLRGINLHYQAMLSSFEMYQSFPCAHVEVAFSYKGVLPAVEAQIRKGLPQGAKLTSSSEVTGSETLYYSLDRGWPLNDEAKLTVVLNFSLELKGQMLEFGGTIDTEGHSAVTAYPPYDPALAPKATGATSSN